MCNTPGLSRICRESYNDPADVYARCKQLGMSIITLTDHDSIDGAEALRRHLDFFLSEEVTVRMPSGTEMHLGVYGISEKDHAEIQRRRNDFIALIMYLTERKLFFSVNHVFSGLNGRRHSDDFSWFASYVPGLEVRNGQMWPQANFSAERLARRMKKVGLAGSDSHTLAGVALTFTEVPGARTIEEYLLGLRAGRGVAHGEHGGYLKLTTDICRFAASLLREKPWAALFLPLAVLIPTITAGHWLNEIRFCKQWAARLEASAKQPRMLWDMDSSFEANWVSWGAAMAVAKTAKTLWGYIENRDYRVMRRMNRWRAPRWFRFWMLSATRMGDGWLWYSLGAILLVAGGAHKFEAVGAAGCAAITGIFIFKALKKLSHRQRPCEFEPHCWSKVLPPDQFSFPSGHTMTAFSIALVVSYFYPSLEGAMYFVAISIALSRVALGMHFLSDVLAGALLGSALGVASIVTFASYGLV